jgi:hypothetical protein
MIEESELVLFILGIVSFIFIITNYSKLKQIPAFSIFMLSSGILLIAWFCTVFEAVFLYDFLNLVEHICYLSSSIMILIWIIFVIKARRSELHAGD